MISKSERELTEYLNKSGETIGVITVNQSGNIFYFYEYDGKEYKKLGKGNSPPELERKFKLDERVGMK